MRGNVYIHKNLTNGKVYVGQTRQRQVSKRWGKDGKGYSKNREFYKDILKYGWENFEHVILPEVHTSQASLDEAERSYIRLFDSVRQGYNRTYGGDIRQTNESKYGSHLNPYPKSYKWWNHNIE